MKYRRILVSLALAFSAIASGGAQASSVAYDMGVLSSNYTLQDVFPEQSTFTDYFNFSIAIPGEFVVSVQSFVLQSDSGNGRDIDGQTKVLKRRDGDLGHRAKNFRDIANLTTALFNTNGTPDNMLDDTQIDLSLISGMNSLDTLLSGSYYAKVTGNATGSQGGYYSVQMVVYPVSTPDVAPIPVPAAAWLLGSGLIGLVGVSRRKQKD